MNHGGYLEVTGRPDNVFMQSHRERERERHSPGVEEVTTVAHNAHI